MENFKQKMTEFLFRTTTCKYMSLNVEICEKENGNLKRKWTCIFLLSIKLSAITSRAIWMPEH